MFQNTKLLVIASFLIIFVGLGLVLIGSASTLPSVASPSPAPAATAQIESSSSASLGIEGEKAIVTQVVDGDTIKVDLNGRNYTVRYVGMDTPETVDPRRPVGCFGKEASNANKSLLSGKMVILQKDVSETDKYGRLLRYVFLPLPSGQTLFVNDYLVREGFAKVLTYPPDIKYNARFLKAQQQARTAKKGLWGRC